MNKNFFSAILLVIVGPIFLISCSQKIKNASTGMVVYPAPPDTTRIQYLTSISGSIDVTGKQSTFSQFLVGNEVEKTIAKPYGIAMHGGKIYVCDTYSHGLEVVNMNSNGFEYFMPTGKGQLKMPINCSVDDAGLLYVADAERKQVVVFNEKGEYLNSFGEAENFKPTDVVIAGEKIFVANIKNHKINVYSKDTQNRLLFSFPETDNTNEGYLFSPTNICVSKDRIYVSDFGDFKVKIYTLDGKFIESIGSYGTEIGQMARPKGIAVDKESNLYVVDAGFENTQVFNKDGKLLMFFGGAYKGAGDMWLPAKVIVDYDHTSYFQKFVDPSFNLKYLILVSNQYGPDKINVYGRVVPTKAGSNENITKQKNNYRKGKPMFK